MQDRLVSRDRECDELQRCLESDRSEFVIISGRRRIGKTFLSKILKNLERCDFVTRLSHFGSKT